MDAGGVVDGGGVVEEEDGISKVEPSGCTCIDESSEDMIRIGKVTRRITRRFISRVCFWEGQDRRGVCWGC